MKAPLYSKKIEKLRVLNENNLLEMGDTMHVTLGDTMHMTLGDTMHVTRGNISSRKSFRIIGKSFRSEMLPYY